MSITMSQCRLSLLNLLCSHYPYLECTVWHRLKLLNEAVDVLLPRVTRVPVILHFITVLEYLFRMRIP